MNVTGRIKVINSKSSRCTGKKPGEEWGSDILFIKPTCRQQLPDSTWPVCCPVFWIKLISHLLVKTSMFQVSYTKPDLEVYCENAWLISQQFKLWNALAVQWGSQGFHHWRLSQRNFSSKGWICNQKWWSWLGRNYKIQMTWPTEQKWHTTCCPNWTK